MAAAQSTWPALRTTTWLEAEWDGIRPKVKEILDSHNCTRGQVSEMALFKLGFDSDAKKKPNTHTLQFAF